MVEIATWSENGHENATWPSCYGNENKNGTQSDFDRRASAELEPEPPDLMTSSSYALPQQ